jgi:hypothetical protein
MGIYRAPLRERVDMRQIIVQESKHYTSYWPASTTEELAKSALAILTENDKSDWYSVPDKLFPADSKWSVTLEQLVPDYSADADAESRGNAIRAYQETINAVPDADARKIMTKKLNDAASRQKQKRSYQKWYDEMRALVDNQDWESVVTFKSGRTEPKSWWLLDERSDHEYEHVSLEPLQEV